MSDQNLQALLDKQAITELAYRYMRALDRLDPDLFASLFHPEGWCEYGFVNCTASEFADFAMNALQEHVANQHFVGNILIDLNGDEAFGEVYFNAYHKIPAEGGGFDDCIIAGRYLDRYEKRDGEWKFTYRSERVDWSRTEPSADSYFKLAPDCLRGARRDDAVFQTANRFGPGAS